MLRDSLLALACLCLLFSLACRKRGTALLEQAQQAWDGNDYATAAARYEDFLRDNPRDPQAAQARFKAANIYLYNLKRQELAIQHYIHLIEDFPKAPEIPQARQRLAESYAAAKKPREAIMEYENLLQTAPGFADKRRTRLNVADLYYDLNELGQALAEYQKVIVQAPYDELTERAQMRVGGIHLIRDEFEEAIAAYQIVTQHTQDAGLRRMARYGLTDSYERTYKYNEAVKILEGTEPDPKTPDYIKQRVASIRELERQRNLTGPAGSLSKRR
ncbi:MAG: tetratricopeptide repeat protein [Acidobacteria bacterium]|nr:tetratricopeptide repeat protein [Acidobacteriota bacterium]MBI3422597.1 tetratricopeptide repeat protein [Acidobacteriota bacterium]